jgi:ferrochelatase
VKQLEDACGLVAARVGKPWTLVYQSRSGPPSQPWLEPDICDSIRAWHREGGLRDLVVMPIGFLSDHLEVLFDLDTQAAELCVELGIGFFRAAAVGVHPAFVATIRELILEQTAGAEARFVGTLGPDPDACNAQCCAASRRPVSAQETSPVAQVHAPARG